MVLLDSINSWDENSIHASSTSHTENDHPLRKDGKLSSLAAIELAAQAMAAHSSITAGDGSQPPRRGFVASTSKINISENRLDTLPSPLDIYVELMGSSGDGSMYSFQITHSKADVISGRLLVMLEAKE